jgi:peptidoglycan/LPS O-acetylase OafA/YrhL
LSDNPSETRLPHLESIRGVAALAVAIHHAEIVYPVDPSLSWLNMVLLTIGNGSGGIFIFFILSGYVLTLSLERTDLSPLVLLGFYVRRFFRIWPALAFAALFALIVVQIFRMFSVPPEAQQFISWAAPTFHFSDAAANIVLMSTKINGPTWTIWTEVCWSALLPALVMLHRNLDNVGRILVFVALFGLHLGTSMESFAFFGYLFYAGAALTTIPAPSSPKAMLAIGLVATFIGPRAIGTTDELSHLCNAVGTFLLLWTAIHNGNTPAFRWAHHPIARHLGRISYSFYLLHMPTLIACAYLSFRFSWIRGLAGNVIMMAASIALTLFWATLAYRFIEAPARQFGKKLTSRKFAGIKATRVPAIEPAT